MVVQRKYSDILADILKKKYSKCVCPSEYLSDLSYKRPSTGGSCHFGPNCEFTATCKFDESKCTCYGMCTCGPQEQSLPATARTEPAGTCTKSCTCKGVCLCKSDESLLFRAPRDCNKAVCTCTVCLCQPDQSSTNFLPTYFRNIVKREANALRMSDEVMKKECQEIKQLLTEHEETKKKTLEKSKLETSADSRKSAKRLSSFCKEQISVQTVRTSSKILDSDKRRSSTLINQNKKALSREGSQSILKSINVSRETKRQSTRKDKKTTRKEKTSKKKSSILPSTARTKFTATYCGCAPTIRKPLRMRYYYSGGTEHYGTRVGHKNCVSKASPVPKNMGWLWNIEDPTKGIRERKGWPPGFIGKNIKNMMQVMKRSEEAEATLAAVAQSGLKSTWKSVEMIEEAQPPTDEPPLLHIHKKGRTYNITFCPRESDEDIGPVPIPFSITEKKRDSCSESSESTLEFELHSPKVRGPPKLIRRVAPTQVADEDETATHTKPPSSAKKQKKKPLKKFRSRGSEENKILWEEHQTQMQNIS